jgi:hypothetical protein
MQSIKSKDKNAKKFLASLGTIRDDVKDALLKNYLMRCSIRHALAFFQWRAKFKDLTDVSAPLIVTGMVFRIKL